MIQHDVKNVVKLPLMNFYGIYEDDVFFARGEGCLSTLRRKIQ